MIDKTVTVRAAKKNFWAPACARRDKEDNGATRQAASPPFAAIAMELHFYRKEQGCSSLAISLPCHAWRLSTKAQGLCIAYSMGLWTEAPKTWESATAYVFRRALRRITGKEIGQKLTKVPLPFVAGGVAPVYVGCCGATVALKKSCLAYRPFASTWRFAVSRKGRDTGPDAAR